MKAIERHLYSRNGYFYYRTAIPRNLHSLLGFREVKIGLATQDLSEARIQAVQLDYEVSRQLKIFQHSLLALSPEQSPQIAIDALTMEIERLKDNFGYRPQAKLVYANWKAKPAQKFLFSQVAQKYLDDCIEDAYSTRFQKENTYQIFSELIGNVPFQDINKEKAFYFKSCLLKIPSNAKKILKIDSFEGFDLDSITVGKPQSSRTVNKRLACMIALFNWAIKMEHYKGNNPFANLTIKIRRSTDPRRPFTPEEIEALFNCPVYRGCLGIEKGERLTAGAEVIKDSLYWIPLIGLYSGLRMNEICQLYVTDIRQESGVFVFDINDDAHDKSLKNASSKRVVPIHRDIIERGFIEYVEQKRSEQEERLFPDIPISRNGSYAKVFSKRFSRVLIKLELNKQGLCFHSLRHTFIDGMRNAGVERAIVMAITGHQSKDVHDSYGHGYNLGVLQKAVNRLSFSSIERLYR